MMNSIAPLLTSLNDLIVETPAWVLVLVVCFAVTALVLPFMNRFADDQDEADRLSNSLRSRRRYTDRYDV